MHVEISSAMYLAGVLLVCVPCLWTVYAAKRDRQLAVAKLEVSRIITRYNKLLLGEEIRGGQVCHNEVYGLMLAVQAMSSYPMPRVHSDESEAAARMRKAIEQEVAEGPKELRDLLAKFVVYYYILVSLRHPVQTKVYTLRLQATVLFYKGIWKAAHLLMAYVRHREERRRLKQSWKLRAGTGLLEYAYGEVKSRRAPSVEDALLSGFGGAGSFAH